jgi:glycosyltransferase involved in cell wall biosynthesis
VVSRLALPRQATKSEAPTTGRPSVFFYSDFPLRSHNVEAERKARAFARAGYDVVYVVAIGIKNPSIERAGKTATIVLRKLRSLTGSNSDLELRAAGLAVLPPRQAPAVRRFNATWVARQLDRAVADWRLAAAWVRWPTPEVVDALVRLKPAAVVYECVDAHWLVPGGPLGPWAAIYERAERELVRLANVVVAVSEPIADRFRRWGAEVRLLPHGVELLPWSETLAQEGPPTIGFVGTLDVRLDLQVIRRIAERHPEWRVRLIGPVRREFDVSALADLTNVTVEQPIPYDRLPETLGSFAAGVLPYFDHPHYLHSNAVKNLELLAAGRPAVARPCPALEPFSDVLYFARTPEEFVDALERALEDDTVERRRARRAAAEANSWDLRLGEALLLLEELLARSTCR